MPRRMRFEHWPEARLEFWMILEEIDDGRGVDQEHGLFGQSCEVYRLHSSRSRRIVRALFLPHNPRPDPLSGVSGCWRTAALRPSIGTSAAMGRPCRVIIV